MQTQMGASSPSLLGNPQMLATLQSLIKQQGPNAAQAAAVAAVSAASQLGQAAKQHALLPKPKAATAPEQQQPPPPVNWQHLLQQHHQSSQATLLAAAAAEEAASLPSPLEIWIGQNQAVEAAALLAAGLMPAAAFPEWALPPSPPPWSPLAGMRPPWPLAYGGLPPPQVAAAPGVTFLGQKRKYSSFLPSPEPSPEGNYIGQHAQGLGGHYADSFFKRKKKN